MLMKILGTGDIIVALIFLLSIFFKDFPSSIVLGFGIFLLVKGIVFALTWDYASFFDIASAVIILLSIPIVINTILSSIVVFYLIQKGIISILV